MESPLIRDVEKLYAQNNGCPWLPNDIITNFEIRTFLKKSCSERKKKRFFNSVLIFKLQKPKNYYPLTAKPFREKLVFHLQNFDWFNLKIKCCLLL